MGGMGTGCVGIGGGGNLIIMISCSLLVYLSSPYVRSYFIRLHFFPGVSTLSAIPKIYIHHY